MSYQEHSPSNEHSQEEPIHFSEAVRMDKLFPDRAVNAFEYITTSPIHVARISGEDSDTYCAVVQRPFSGRQLSVLLNNVAPTQMSIDGIYKDWERPVAAYTYAESRGYLSPLIQRHAHALAEDWADFMAGDVTLYMQAIQPRDIINNSLSSSEFLILNGGFNPENTTATWEKTATTHAAYALRASSSLGESPSYQLQPDSVQSDDGLFPVLLWEKMHIPDESGMQRIWLTKNLDQHSSKELYEKASGLVVNKVVHPESLKPGKLNTRLGTIYAAYHSPSFLERFKEETHKSLEKDGRTYAMGPQKLPVLIRMRQQELLKDEELFDTLEKIA